MLLLEAHKDGLIWRKEMDIQFYETPYCKGADIVGKYLLTYLLTPWCRVLLEKVTGLQLVK